ncbi:uncharacterized protein Bulli [Epargyreus clarus]|uniref:uncharacterized protein Bulli n=1 Tax=Epargyreus clarus TaxID=520877 RepID=UPI003C2CE530
MTKFCLKDSDEYYLSLSEQHKRFDADSPATNVFFDDTNGQVFTVRSGGVTGVTVSGMDQSKSTSFRMEDKGPIISIKFSPDHKVLAIQRNTDGQAASVEFVNFKDLLPTNVEYTHTCKWKNSKILGFVWPKANEIAYITDHGIELLQIIPEKKQLKTLKSTSFSGAWFLWCAQSNIVLLAGNNGALLQPFSLNSSTVTKLQKLELDSAKPVVERDVFILRLCDASWCAIFRHGSSASHSTPGPTEVWLMPITVPGGIQHVLKTGLVGRFAVSVVDHLLVIHHQSSQTSQLFDIMEESKPENNTVVHIPIVQGISMKPATVDGQRCPMYSGNWVVFQPDYIIDARLGCLWRVQLIPSGLAHSVPKDEISKIVAVLLRRKDGKDTIYRILNQLVSNAATYLVELTKCFDEINAVYRKWADLEVARNTAGQCVDAARGPLAFPVLLAQPDVCAHVLQPHADDAHLVQVRVCVRAAGAARRPVRGRGARPARLPRAAGAARRVRARAAAARGRRAPRAGACVCAGSWRRTAASAGTRRAARSPSPCCWRSPTCARTCCSRTRTTRTSCRCVCVCGQLAPHGGQCGDAARGPLAFPVLLAQPDVCAHVLQPHADDAHLVQVRVCVRAAGAARRPVRGRGARPARLPRAAGAARRVRARAAAARGRRAPRAGACVCAGSWRRTAASAGTRRAARSPSPCCWRSPTCARTCCSRTRTTRTSCRCVCVCGQLAPHGGQCGDAARGPLAFPVLLAQPDVCAHVLQPHADDAHLVQVVTAYLSSLSRHTMVVQHAAAELCVRALLTRGAAGRLRALLRRRCLQDARPLACQLLSLGHLDPAAAQLALDMMCRLRGHEEIVEVLLSWSEPVSAAGAARQAGVWAALAPRKLLAAAQHHPRAFLAIYHALRARNERLRGSPHFTKGEQCDIYVEHYKQLMSESSE